MPLRELRNLGPRSEQMLALAGIKTRDQLRELGPVRAYLAVRQTGAKPSRNLLWALAGALSDKHWNEIGTVMRAQMENELADLIGSADEHGR